MFEVIKGRRKNRMGYVYRDVFGVEGGIGGRVMVVGGIVDGFVDGSVGILCEGSERKWGKYGGWVLWRGVGLMVLYVLGF